MSKYKSPIGGSGKRTTNQFYRSGISSLLSRIEKLENEAFCCKDSEDVFSIDGTATLTRSTHNYSTILWAAEADAETLTLFVPKNSTFRVDVTDIDTTGQHTTVVRAHYV